jgi:hypothetical protein
MIDYCDLPLHQAWERVVAKELAEILYGCCCRGFDSPLELAARLAELEVYLREIGYGSTD